MADILRQEVLAGCMKRQKTEKRQVYGRWAVGSKTFVVLESERRGKAHWTVGRRCLDSKCKNVGIQKSVRRSSMGQNLKKKNAPKIQNRPKS